MMKIMPIYSSTFGQMGMGINGIAPPPPIFSLQYFIPLISWTNISVIQQFTDNLTTDYFIKVGYHQGFRIYKHVSRYSCIFKESAKPCIRTYDKELSISNIY